MKYLITLCFCGIFGLSNAQSYADVFITADELAARLTNNSTVVIHVDGPEGYAEGHIPGAVLMSSQDFTTRKDDIVFEIPESEAFATALSSRGIGENSFIVISTGWDSFEHAYRLYYTLDYFGLGSQTRILDGGLRGWYVSGHDISTEIETPVAVSPMNLTANPDKLATANWVRDNSAKTDIKILDARIDGYYSGKSGNFKRGGHIAGAGRVTWLDLVDDNFYLADQKELKKLFKSADADDVTTIATYCHIGLRASVLYTVAKSLGYNVKLYDGSMNEWETLDDSYPLEKGSQEK